MPRCPVCDCYFEGRPDVCPRCGTIIENLEKTKKTDAVSIESIVRPLANLMCEACRKAEMVLVDGEGDIPSYRCPKCGTYKGNYLHKGKFIYYTEDDLKVGRFIDTKLSMTGHLLLPVKNYLDLLAEEVEESTGLDRRKAKKSIAYLEREDLLHVINKRDYCEVRFP